MKVYLISFLTLIIMVITVPLIFILLIFSAYAQSVSVECVGGACNVYKPDRTILATPGTTTFGMQEAATFAWVTNKHSLEFKGDGSVLNLSNITLNMPAQVGLPFRCSGLSLNFINNAQDGIVFDTQTKSVTDTEGCRIIYSGTGRALLQKPCTSLLFQPASGLMVPWSLDQIYKFGHIEASGNNPFALYGIDPSCTLGEDQYHSSSFVNNKVSFGGLEGQHFTVCNYKVYSPANSSLQIMSENIIDLGGNVQGAGNTELCIGTFNGNQDGNALGLRNEYYLNISHWASGNGTYGIVTNAAGDRFTARSWNAYSGGTPIAAYFGPQATGNCIMTKQIIGWSVLTQGPGTANTIAANC